MLISDVSFRSDIVYDIALVACGYEERSSYLVRSGLQARRKVAVDLGPGPFGNYDANRLLLKQMGWDIVRAPEALSLLFEAAGSRAIDISSMPRRLLASIVQEMCSATAEVDATVYYSPAEFSMSSLAAGRAGTLTADPMSSFFQGAVRHPSIPLALILGLGLEPHRSIGLVELLEPTKVFALMGHSNDPRFSREAHEINQEILSAENTRVLAYDVGSLARTYSALESLCFSLGPDYRVVIAPSGPKLLSFASLLVGCGRARERPAIWRVGARTGDDATDVAESGEVIGARVVIEPGASLDGDPPVGQTPADGSVPTERRAHRGTGHDGRS